MSGTAMQNLAVLVIVLAAAAYLVSRALSVFRRRSANGCGAGCEQCPTGSQAPDERTISVIPLQDLTDSVKQLRNRS